MYPDNGTTFPAKGSPVRDATYELADSAASSSKAYRYAFKAFEVRLGMGTITAAYATPKTI